MSDETITVTAARKPTHWRQVRARLLVNGTERAETRLMSFTLQRTRYSRADTLSLSLAVDRVRLATVNGKWWDVTAATGASLPDINVTLQLRDEEKTGAQWTSVFSGIVDRVQWAPPQAALGMECRDYLARLLDQRVQTAWMNHTGPEVVEAAITAAGLTPDVEFPASMNGQFWEVEHKRTTAAMHHRFQTAYDLARYIADEFGCDLYAKGTTIVCKPVGSPTDASAVVHRLRYDEPAPDQPIQTAALTLQLERDYITSKNLVVHVMSWDSRQRTTAETFYSAEGHSRTLAENAGKLYTFRFPGLRQDVLDQRAEQLYARIVAHDRTVSATMPGRITLEPRHFMTISGTNSSWDVQTRDAYSVDAVTSSYSWDAGYTQTVTLRNREASNGSNDDATE